MIDQVLTPYDTGDRLEPHPWVRGEVVSPSGLPRRASAEDYGRVDFDDDEGRTVLTVHVERTVSGYVLYVENLSEPVTVEATAPEYECKPAPNSTFAVAVTPGEETPCRPS